jgi:hypothetical protein
MNIKLIKLLAAICAGLLFLIICEWLYAMYAQNQLLDNVDAANKQKKSGAQLPTVELSKRPEANYKDLVERPLFIQGRKPVNEPDTVQAPVTNMASENFNWALNGIYTSQKKLYALFSRTTGKVAKDNYRKVTKDNDIEGWKVTEITKDKVIVSQGDKQKELPLRKVKPKDATSNTGNSVVAPPPNQFGQALAPNQQPIAVPQPVPEPVEEPELEPELIPDESSDPNFENSDEE